MKNSLIIIISLLSFCVGAKDISEPLKSESLRKEAVAKRVSIVRYKEDISDKNAFLPSKLTLTKNTEVKLKLNPDGVFVSRRSAAIQTRQAAKVIQKTENQKLRDNNSLKSPRAFWFDIYDSWISLDNDLDSDGYFSDFSLNFDADFHDDNSSNTYAQVYAKIYTSLEGGEWLHLYTSEEFTLYSTSADDYYSVSFGLNYDFPTGEYDILIDLYEVGYSGIVVTAGPEDDVDLFGLPLEDKRFEVNSDNTLISYVASDLYTDKDRDGYYTQLTLEYDIDTYDTGRIVYAEIEIINVATSALFKVYTDNFILDSQTEFIDIDFSSGYNTSHYDFKIKLYDDISGELLALAAQDFSSLNELPIESDEYDYLSREVDVHVSGGGSLGFYAGLFLLSFGVFNRFKK